MNFKYKGLFAGIIALSLLCGCAGEENAPLSSGDLPVTTPVITSAPESPTDESLTATEPPVDASDVTTSPEGEDPTVTSESAGYEVYEQFSTLYATDTVNVREQPSTDSQIVGQLNPGDDVKVTGFTSNGWYRVDYNGGIAFVFAEYFSDVKPELPKEELVIPENYYFANADDYFFVVNKDVFLPDDYAIETDFVQGSYELEIVAAYYCKQMIKAAEADGIDLKVLSAYRTIEYQQNLFDRNVKYRMDDGMSYEEAYYDVSINIAPPGGSEHNAGLAVDIIDKNHWDTYEEFEDTKEFKWLSEHCTEYGFILRYPKGKEGVTGYIYEPWHYRYVGTKYASAVMTSGLCLEEYLNV